MIKNFLEKSLNISLYKNRPVSLIHFLTNKCNARCPHCFIDFDNKKTQNDNMSLDSIELITKSVGKQLMNVNFTGGEPFLNPQIKEICELYLINTSVDSIFFSTNGAMTKQIVELAKYLTQRYPDRIFTFSMSIDHIGEKHDDYRGVKNLYRNALNTYYELLSIGENCQSNITITVSEFNAGEVEGIFNTLYEKEGIRAITANIVRNEGVYKIDKSMESELHIGYKKLTSLIRGKDTFVQNSNFIARMMNEKERILYDYIEDVFINPGFRLPCNAGAGLLGIIYPNGDVYPCEILNKKMGNLYDYEMNMEKLWSDNQRLRKWIKKSKCNCSYECAWSYNILSSPKHMAKMAYTGLKK